MISWIQRTFQQHYRTVFMVLLTIVIVTFVFTIGAMPGGGGANNPRARELQLFGRSLTTEAEKRRFSEDASLSLQLRAYQGITSEAQYANYPFYRAAGLYLADEVGIPEPNAAQLQEFIRTLPLFAGPDGKYDPQAYARFRDNFRLQSDLPESRVVQVMMEDWRLKQVTNALTGPGYVNDADLRQAFENSETLWTVQTARLDLNGIKPAGEPSADELQRWFDAQSFRYDTPEKMVVDYVEFRAADFQDDVHPTDEEITSYFETNRARYQKPAPPPPADATTPPPPPPETTLADVRDQVVADLTKAQAIRLAANAASQFAVARFQAGVTPASPQFEAFLNAHHAVLQTTPAFTHTEPPPGTNWPPPVLDAAFSLDAEHPVSDEVRAGDNTVLLFFQEHIPPAPQTLDAVREKVTEDVRQDLRRQAIVARGEELRQQLNAAVAAGKSFADAAKEAGLETKTWEKFKRSEPPPDLDGAVLGTLTDAPLHEVAPMSVQENTGTFVFVADKEIPSPESAPDAYTRVQENMRAYFGQLSSSAVLDELVTAATTAAGLTDDTGAVP